MCAPIIDGWLALTTNVVLLVSNPPAEPRRIVVQDKYAGKRRTRGKIKRERGVEALWVGEFCVNRWRSLAYQL